MNCTAVHGKTAIVSEFIDVSAMSRALQKKKKEVRSLFDQACKKEKIRHQTKLRMRRMRAKARHYDFDESTGFEVRPESDYRTKGRKSVAEKHARSITVGEPSDENLQVCALDTWLHEDNDAYEGMDEDSLQLLIRQRDSELELLVSG